jgi:hypothetical protein
MKLTLKHVLSLLVVVSFALPNAFCQVANFDKTWEEFLKDDKVSSVSELAKPPKADAKNYAKYCLIYATVRFCNSKITEAESFLAEIDAMGDSEYDAIPGFRTKYTDIKTKMAAYHKTDELWEKFLIDHSVDLGELGNAKEALRVCEKGTLAKYTYMEAYAYYCSGSVDKAKDRFDTRVLAIVDRTSLEMSDVKGLSNEVKTMRSLITSVHKLDAAWDSFLRTGKSNGFSDEIPVFECNKTPLIKAYILEAASDVCGKGEAQLKKIRAIQSSNSQQLDSELAAKIKWLEDEAGNNSGDLVALNKAWSELMEYNWVDNPVSIDNKYCRKEDQIKALIMHGVINDCLEGPESVEKVEEIKRKYNLNLSKDVAEKLQYLKDKINQNNENIVDLNKIWKEFIQNGDTMKREFVLSALYCDKVSQVTSWVIKGHFDHCDQGEHYLNLINKMTKDNNVPISEELKCRIQRLKVKVWNCQIDRLHRETQLNIVAERENLARTTSQNLENALNASIGCSSKIEYEMTDTMGFGLVFSLTTTVCKNVDLAKLTEKRYIQQVADWINKDLIAPYCKDNDACIEDFYIYIIGYADGSPLKKEIYTGEYAIPAESPYMHIVNGKEVEKATKREISEELKSKEELAFARAFTVNYQLEDVVKAPIYLAAQDFGPSETGSQYNKVEIRVNLTNLLKDKFYTDFADAVKDAGLSGKRPNNCNN